tara:strand:+ start:21482 stop:22015 length:534 start_codon:yes stop_codon:yes gene_type:complete
VRFDTAEEAWKYTRQNNEDISDPRCAGRQFEATQQVHVFHEKHLKGDTTALPYALAICAHHGLAMPNWLSEVIYNGIVSWHNFETGTLDDAFGVSRKGRRKPDELNYRRHRDSVFQRVLVRVQDGESVDDELFELIADEMNAGFAGGTCKRWFYRYLDESPVAQSLYDHCKGPARKK